MAFGQRLQEVRRNNGMTQEDFAAQLKVSRQAVSKWESCRGYPEIEKIIYICNRYGVTMNELFAEEVPLAAPETAPERMEERTLNKALGDFCSNLSPWNKWLFGGSFAAATLLILLSMGLLKGGSDNMMSIVWVGAVVVFGVVEAATAGLVSIWFVVGAVAALIAAQVGVSVLAQMVVFLAVSAAALAATRPLVRKLTAGNMVPTNADRVLGSLGKVTETIDNGNSKGAVYVDGKSWTARSVDGTVISAGTQVRIEGLEGVKLLVRPCQETGAEHECVQKEEETV